MKVLVYKVTFLFLVEVVLPFAAFLGGYSPWRTRSTRRFDPPTPAHRALAGPREVGRHPA